MIASTDQPSVNAQVASDCRRLGILVNVTDDPAGCDYTVPAIIERGAVQIAVSTGGQSPALARRIRERLEEVIGIEYSEVNEILGSLREPAQNALATDADRKQFFDALLESGIVVMLGEGKKAEALERKASEAQEVLESGTGAVKFSDILELESEQQLTLAEVKLCEMNRDREISDFMLRPLVPQGPTGGCVGNELRAYVALLRN